ncbi:MAG: hypothetical protein ACOCXJ_02070 [Planctomycetota bacterium]
MLRVQGVTTVDGRTLLELPLGSADGISTASFFRVYDPEHPDVIKCMVKVQEVLGPDQSVGVLIGGLFDTARPVAVGDPVRPVEDLALLGGGYAVERRTRLTEQRLDEADAATRKRFDKLRTSYQERLQELIAERDAALVRQQARHERELQDLQAEHRRSLERKDLERRSDLTALRTSLLAEAEEQVQRARREQGERIAELEAERDRLQTQVGNLVQEQDRLHARIANLVSSEAELRRRHEVALRAEAETRAILEQRLARIESDLSAGEQADTVLPNEPERSETVLERLERITAERDRAQRQVRLLDGRVEQIEQELQLREQRLSAAQQRLDQLERQQGAEQARQERLQQLETALVQAREHRDAASLARMEAERHYYELMLRVLRLPNEGQDQLRYLQQRLRDLGDEAGEEP